MSPIYFTIDNNLPIMVIPVVKVLLDGHAILTYSYNIFYGVENENPEMSNDNKNLSQDKLINPNYYGCLSFDDPERLFSFNPDGLRQLTHNQLEEIIERIKHYRDNPALWKLQDN